MMSHMEMDHLDSGEQFLQGQDQRDENMPDRLVR